MRLLAVLAMCAVLGSSSSPVLAADEGGPAATPAPGADQIQFAAREHDLGYRAYLDHDYDEAATHFENAFFAAPNPAELRSAIRARRDAGELARSATLAAMGESRYSGDAAMSKLAGDSIAAARPHVYEVHISSDEDFTVAVDEKIVAVQRAKETRVFLVPGSHEVLVTWSDDQTARVPVEAKAGQSQVLRLDPPARAPAKVPVAPPAPAPPAPAPPATPPARLLPAARRPAFNPLSVTFVSLHRGWALGTVPCQRAGQCAALRSTDNSGKTWSAAPVPVGLRTLADHKIDGRPELEALPGVLEVRFADPSDGWISGGLTVGQTFEPLLWATHDGGATWRRQPVLPGMAYGTGPLMDVEAAGGTVYALVPGRQGAHLDASAMGRNYWRPVPTPRLPWPAGGAQPTGSIVLHGGAGWLVVGNDRGVTGSARMLPDGQWTAWSPPCENVGNTYSVPAASAVANLVAVCQMGGFASPLSASAPAGASIGSSWLYFSYDGGYRFIAGGEVSRGPQVTFGPVASPKPGAVLLGRTFIGKQAAHHQLISSFDYGHHWVVAYRGDVFYVGFTSPSQGVALVQLSAGTTPTTAMIMSFDGGHRWQKVVF
ncbi:MAG: WD40/YVTN/BNR-like repeat-containing protein [Acidimicrobiales bacterium]